MGSGSRGNGFEPAMGSGSGRGSFSGSGGGARGGWGRSGGVGGGGGGFAGVGGGGESSSTSMEGLERLPPQNLEAERGVLGSILLDQEILHEIIPILDPDDFYRDAHQEIYRAIRELYDQGRAVDAITVSDELARRGTWDRIGGEDTMVEVMNSVPHAANGVYYSQIVREKSVSRRLIHSAHQIIEEGYGGQLTADQALEAAERRIFQIAEARASGETHDLRTVVVEAMDRISQRAEARQPLTGVSTGYVDLDQLTGGFQPSQLVILAARPSMGKTAFALNICEHVALELGKPILFVSLEMGRLELAERLLCARSRVESNKLRTGQMLGSREMAALGHGYADLQRAPIFIDETPARTVLQINANCRRLRMRHGIGLVVVDYIQLIDGDGEGRESRQEQIAKISRRLKTLARELETPVLALSQLNRAVEQREDRRPRMADLRESGAIEQDADLVLLLHRPEYYDANDQPGIGEVIVAKNRNGATGTAKLTFLKEIMRFENYHVEGHPASPF